MPIAVKVLPELVAIVTSPLVTTHGPACSASDCVSQRLLTRDRNIVKRHRVEWNAGRTDTHCCNDLGDRARRVDYHNVSDAQVTPTMLSLSPLTVAFATLGLLDDAVYGPV